MSILVFVEQRDGKLRGVSREALGQASRLAATLGGPVVGVCTAVSDPGLAKLGEAGADQVLLASHPEFARYHPGGAVAAIWAACDKV